MVEVQKPDFLARISGSQGDGRRQLTGRQRGCWLACKTLRTVNKGCTILSCTGLQAKKRIIDAPCHGKPASCTRADPAH